MILDRADVDPGNPETDPIPNGNPRHWVQDMIDLNGMNYEVVTCRSTMNAGQARGNPAPNL